MPRIGEIIRIRGHYGTQKMLGNYSLASDTLCTDLLVNKYIWHSWVFASTEAK